MTNRADILDALAERVEKASAEEQAELIGDAWDALGPITRPTSEEAAGFARMMDAEAYESAAVMLVPITWKLRQMHFSAPCADDRKWHLNLHGGREGENIFVGRGATQAAALTAACLRAHASIERTKNNG